MSRTLYEIITPIPVSMDDLTETQQAVVNQWIIGKMKPQYLFQISNVMDWTNRSKRPARKIINQLIEKGIIGNYSKRIKELKTNDKN